MPVLPTWFFFVAAPVLGIGFYLLFQWIFSLDDDPSQRADTLYIPITMSANITSLIFIFIGAGLVMSGFYDLQSGVGKSFLLLPFGLFFAVVAGAVRNTHLWFDNEGIHYHAGISATRNISWGNLTGYDVHTESNASNDGFTVYYTLRSTDGTKIALSRSSYDTDYLLAKIRTHKDIREQPYKRQGFFNS